MSKGNVLVFDPVQSEESGKISKIIKGETGCRSTVVEGAAQKFINDLSRPELIFAFLQCCEEPGQKILYERFFKHFSMIPCVGIVNCSSSCQDCSVLQKHIWNFITPPVTRPDILLNIQKFLPDETIDPQRRINSVIKEKIGFNLLQGRSACLLRSKEKICRVAPYDVNVLLHGETGTGKELSARLIHFLSPRSKNPFIPVNCGAIPRDLFENELFGHKKGAYTHAEASEAGLVTAAEGGTLFLDEVEALAESTQVKLLRFLEEKKYKPLGQSDYRSADVRVIAAAKEDLWERVQKRQFREDLFYRLNVSRVSLPPLRERTEDIPVLVEYFINRYTVLYHKTIEGIKPAALLALIHHEWPGNIRELENVVQEAVVTTISGWIGAGDIDLNKLGKSDRNGVESFKAAKQKNLENFERSYLQNLMSISNGNITHAAKFAQKDRRAFCRLLKKYGIDAGDYRV
jgi:DNA-binding NtrC family response regulator